MTDHRIEPLSQADHAVIMTSGRNFCLGHIAELVSIVNFTQQQLGEVWDSFEKRFGPELDPMIRGTVLQALGRDR